MLRGIYSVASAMEAASRNQDIVAENLTHLVTPGYRRQGTYFAINDTPSDSLAPPARGAMSRADLRAYSSFDGGPLQQTNNPLDLALVGNGFFVVDGPNGPLYTRNGGFERGVNGQLQTRSGYPLRGNGGPLTIPQNATQISVTYDGAVYANNARIGQLQLATFARPEELTRVGTTLFSGPAPQTPAAGEIRIEQGYREGSNVQPVQEMVAMMLGMRYYQAAEKAMTAISEAVSQNTRSPQ